MPETFKIKILDIGPSQLFISEYKLNQVFKWLNYKTLEKYEPIPIKKLNGRIIFTDGHTRAFVLYKMGIEFINVYWDEDNFDWTLYEKCVDWCLREGIKNVSNFEERIITKEDYEILWINRCEVLQKDLKKKYN